MERWVDGWMERRVGGCKDGWRSGVGMDDGWMDD